jgi:hypothetical protein
MDEMITRSRSLGGNQRERIDRRIKTILLRRGEIGQAVDRCMRCKTATGRHTVGRRRQLGRQEKPQHSSIAQQLQPALEKRDRQIRLVGEAAATAVPPPVACPQAASLRRRKILGPHPRRVPYHDVEPALRDHVCEVALKLKPGHLPFVVTRRRRRRSR